MGWHEGEGESIRRVDLEMGGWRGPGLKLKFKCTALEVSCLPSSNHTKVDSQEERRCEIIVREHVTLMQTM